jgi:phosphoribosylformylglycinamidine synthase II
MPELYRKILENVFEINILEADDSELKEISRGKSLGLSLGEMKKIRGYFKKEERNPTDVELEAFAQSWSEHCCYKTSKPILKKTVFDIKAPQNICVISEDAGVVDFDREHAYVVALESHNHPSALDPYGGAATGIGGILRDVICMGAQPIALIDPLFFGPLNYPEDKLPRGTKHPRYLFKGVVSGIADYGNRVGIPTVAGMVDFHESYVSNCLVNVGCIGIVKKRDVIHSRVGGKGDIYILAGGKTGRDGIHGVTFASAELGAESEEKDIPAVQLGYAIMKEPLMHACLEANKKGLLTGMKDFGGGGLSCVAGEMAYAGGKGAVIDLDKIPLKQEGMAPWEIWVSESQERMMVSVKPGKVEKVLEIFKFWDVPATIVGDVDNSRRVKATYKGEKVLDLDLGFLLGGVVYERPYKVVEREDSEPEFKIPDLAEIIPQILNSPRIGSKECIIRRYDHEVRGNTILKPIQGLINSQTHGDAAVMKPLQNSFQGLAITADVNPLLCKQDPYWGAASAVDEVVRNLVSVNSTPHSMADCLNFGNPEKEDRLGDFIKCCEGLYFAANSYGIPFVSGNVSFYNEGTEGAVAPTPVLLGIGIVSDVRKVVSSDLKKEGNIIYLIGKTLQELRGSEYHRTLGLEGGKVPRVHPEDTMRSMDSLLKAMDEKLVKSCHDLSTGGLLAAAAEMCFGGDLGLELEMRVIGDLRSDVKLFSESNGRWLVEVENGKAGKFESIVEGIQVGKVMKEKELRIKDKGIELELPLKDLRDKWNSAVEREK